MDQAGQEEYIWAMRYRGRETEREERERRTSLQKVNSDYLLNQKKKGSKLLLPQTSDHHTKVLASLVPDEIIYNVNDYTHRHYDSCLLFGDVSGNI